MSDTTLPGQPAQEQPEAVPMGELQVPVGKMVSMNAGNLQLGPGEVFAEVQPYQQAAMAQLEQAGTGELLQGEDALNLYKINDPATQAALAIAMEDFMVRTAIEIGVILRQMNRRAAEITNAEIEKFAREHDMHITKTPAGALRYEMTLKGKLPSWERKEKRE